MQPWIYEPEPDWSGGITDVQEAYRKLSFEELYEIVKKRNARLGFEDVYHSIGGAEYLPSIPLPEIELSTGDRYALAEIAENQLRETVGLKDKEWFTKIPRDLKGANINWGLYNLQRTGSTHKVFRLVRGATCRAVLSDRYKLFDDLDILEQLRDFVEIHPNSYVSYASFCQESSHFRIILNKKHAVKVGDEVAEGIHIRNSEVGRGGVSLKAIIYRLVCGNGMTIPKDTIASVYMTHLRDPADVSIAISQFIRKLEEVSKRTVEAMKESLDERIANMKNVLGFLRQKNRLLRQDLDGIKRYVAKEEPTDSRFALVNGITRYAATLHGDQRLRLEDVASKALHQPFEEFMSAVVQWGEKRSPRQENRFHR